MLVGDRKITGDTDVTWDAKVWASQHPPFAMGSSGVLGLFEKQRREFERFRGMNKIDFSSPYYTDIIVNEVEREVLEINAKYNQMLQGSVFEVLIAIQNVGARSSLQHVLPNGLAERIRTYRVIGHGKPYGSLILKKLWKDDLTTLEAADLGYAIIKMIERYELDSSVGVGDGCPTMAFALDDQEAGNTNPDSRNLQRI